MVKVYLFIKINFKLLFYSLYYFRFSNLRNYQILKINEVINHAIKYSLFYQKFYNNHDISITQLSDLKKLPILKKDLLKNAVLNNTFLSTNFNRQSLSCGDTTGSTGQPLTVCLDSKSVKIKNYYQEKIFQKIGFVPYKKTVKIWREKKISLFEKFLEKNKLLLNITVGDINDPNSFDKEDTLYLKINEIIDFQPVVIRGYVSSLIIIANELEKRNWKIKSLETVITSAEFLSDLDWDYLSSVFKCKIVNLYGGTEASSIAYSDFGRNMNLLEELYYIELLDTYGNEVEPGKEGLITITDLHSKSFPLIRYQIGDLAIADESWNYLRGNSRYFKQVIGRQDDIIILSDGKIVYPHLWYVYFRNETYIKNFKIVQQSENVITMHFNLSQELFLEKFIELKDKLIKLYPQVNFEWDISGFVPEYNGGKLKNIISISKKVN